MKHIIPESMKNIAVEDCQTVEEFAHKYRRKDRFIRRGPDYVAAIMESHYQDIESSGYTCISHHDNNTGEFIAFIPPEEKKS